MAGTVKDIVMSAKATSGLRLDHVGFVVSDLDAAVSWYVEALGCTVQWTEAWTDVDPKRMGLEAASQVRLRGAILRVGQDIFLELHEFASPESGDGKRRTCDLGLGHLSFFTPHIEQDYGRLERLGVRWYGKPAEIADGGLKGHWWCYGRDPFDMLIQLNWWPEIANDVSPAT
jgi:catechol 2,3-dioxygenase-like lactoylglutathione lyase family enzyme